MTEETGGELQVRETAEGVSFPVGTSFDDWWAYREKLLEIREWRQGLEVREALYAIDWVKQGIEMFGEDAAGQALGFVQDEFGWSERTYYDYSGIQEDFPPERRKLGLGISHYKVVRALPQDLQNELLDLASEHKWVVEQLKKVAKHHKAQLEGKPPPKENPSKAEIVSAARRLLSHCTPAGDHYAAYAQDVEDLARLLDYRALVSLVVEPEQLEIE